MTEENKSMLLPGPTQEVIVIANTPQEMGVAQANLKAWLASKLSQLNFERNEAKSNLEHAIRGKIRSEPFRRLVAEKEKKIATYTKVLAAVNEGYALIPEFPIDVISVRTSRVKPPSAIKRGKHRAPHVPSVDTNSPALGEGRHVSPNPFVKELPSVFDPKDDTEIFRARADEFDEEIEFPFRLVKPQILEELTRAQEAKIFDRIGYSPQRAGMDPMVIGQIVHKRGGWQQDRVFNFLISWWIDTRDLAL